MKTWQDEVTHASLLDVGNKCIVSSDFRGLVDATIGIHSQELARGHLGLQSGHFAHCTWRENIPSSYCTTTQCRNPMQLVCSG